MKLRRGRAGAGAALAVNNMCPSSDPASPAASGCGFYTHQGINRTCKPQAEAASSAVHGCGSAPSCHAHSRTSDDGDIQSSVRENRRQNPATSMTGSKAKEGLCLDTIQSPREALVAMEVEAPADAARTGTDQGFSKYYRAKINSLEEQVPAFTPFRAPS